MCIYNKKKCVYIYMGVVLINILVPQLGLLKQKFLALRLIVYVYMFLEIANCVVSITFLIYNFKFIYFS